MFITPEEYTDYFKTPAPENLERLEFLGISILENKYRIDTNAIDPLKLDCFKKALMEQIELVNTQTIEKSSGQINSESLGDWRIGYDINSIGQVVNERNTIIEGILKSCGLFSRIIGCR